VSSLVRSYTLLSHQHDTLPSLEFSLPPKLEASLPPEERGLHRDQVRLMVSYCSTRQVIHSRFEKLPEYMDAGDVLVINTSKTMRAALEARRADGAVLELHLSTHLPSDLWVVELRLPVEQGGKPFYAAEVGERFDLPGGGGTVLHAPYPENPPRRRLWAASLELPGPLEDYLEQHGFPIRYNYVRSVWPMEYYQNVYATETGSAEMPSAGRAFTPELITNLVARGVIFAPLLLHTGVASLEEDEQPYEEYYRVPASTAGLVNLARASGKRVIAVGTTAVRALQTVTGRDGIVREGEGWTGLVITPGARLTSIDGLLTGLHEPRSTHLSMLFAVAGYEHTRLAYRQALEHKYLWHEFGDLHLILP
jgi:S-adenosylmethionine:tRNA ribosyltransferase-isomerase